MAIGGSVFDYNAARVAAGLGADAYLFDSHLEGLRVLDARCDELVSTCYDSGLPIEQRLPELDMVIGAVLVHGARASCVIGCEHVALPRPGAVLVDVEADHGGCAETSRPRTHRYPTCEVDRIVRLADQNVVGALVGDPGFAAGLNPCAGQLADEAVMQTRAGARRVFPRAARGPGVG